MKIRTKLAAAALVPLLPILLGLSVITGTARQSTRASTISLITEYVDGIASDVAAFFANGAGLVKYLASLQSNMMLPWNEGAKTLFVEYADMNDFVADTSFITEDGSYYISSNPGNPAQNGRLTINNSDPNAPPVLMASTEQFLAVVTNNTAGRFFTYVTEPYLPRELNYKCVTTAAPVIIDGKPRAVVCAVQTGKDFTAFYSKSTAGFYERFGQSARLYLLSDGGQLVSSLEYADGAYVDTLAEASELVSSETLGEEALSAFGEAERSGRITEASLGGTKCFVASARIEATPFTLCFVVAQSAMLGSANMITALSIVSFIVIAAILFCILFGITRSMAASLRLIDRTMQDIGEGSGDLTARLEERGSDELGSISKSFNKFVDTLHGMISSVSESAETMSASGETLLRDTGAISGDVSSITRDMDNLNFAIEEQSASLTEASATITQIAQTIESLTAKIESQSTAVTQSSASVQQMVSNIGSISESVSKAVSSFEELKSTASGGRESIGAVQDLVNKLSSQSDSLLEANNVIDNIASQTNLLAMNAAIEAAHAGEAGKGFSVVAEEIRKLAEDSAEQSRTIAAGLKATIDSIRNIAQATATADSAFDNVASRINAVVTLAEEINLALHEQNAGSRQVLDALQDIENVTAQIRDGSVEMNTGTAAILKEMARLSDSSRQVQERSVSIAKAADAISGAVSEIVEASRANKEAVDVLAGVTGKFKL